METKEKKKHKIVSFRLTHPFPAEILDSFVRSSVAAQTNEKTNMKINTDTLVNYLKIEKKKKRKTFS